MAEWLKTTPENVELLKQRHRLVIVFGFGPDALGADDWTDAVAAIVPGYEQLDAGDVDGQLRERILHAVSLQVQLQAIINDNLDLSGVSSDDLAILTGPRTHQPDIEVWRSPVPLILVDYEYQPHGAKPRPVGIMPDGEPEANLLWLDPSDEASLLLSMQRTRIVDIVQDDDTAGPHSPRHDS